MCENLHQKFFFDMLPIYKSIIMPIDTPTPSNNAGAQESFLKTSSGPTDNSNPYGDFFQETSDGNISIWTKSQKSWLEIATWILTYIIPIAIIFTILGGVNVFIRSKTTNTFAENYSFVCPLLNIWIELEDKGCKTMKMIETEYTEKSNKVKEEILNWLTEYIPIKISKNVIDASPEKAFIMETFENKIFVDDIIKQFEKIRISATHANTNNIECNGISITNGDTMSTQCTIYGGKIGTDDTSNKLWSARIEALSFLDEIANTSKSQFILLNPPSSLNVESIIAGDTLINPQFETKTTVQIQVQYVSFNKKS